MRNSTITLILSVMCILSGAVVISLYESDVESFTQAVNVCRGIGLQCCGATFFAATLILDSMED